MEQESNQQSSGGGFAGTPAPGDGPSLEGSSYSSFDWISDGMTGASLFVQTYGWFLVGIALLSYLLWTRVRDQFYALYDNAMERREIANTDPSVVIARQEAMAAARARMQREADEKSRLHAEKQMAEEERKRSERVEDWDKHQRGEGYRSRVKKTDESKKKKGSLRDNDYNPLMGAGGGGGGFQRASGRHTFRSSGGG